jgi:hypothetical protein
MTVMGRCAIAVVGAIMLLAAGIADVSDPNLKYLWDMSFGTANADTLIDFNGLTPYRYPLLSTVLIANLPQLVLSCLYFAYNGIFTCMLSHDWPQNKHHFGFSSQVVDIPSPGDVSCEGLCHRSVVGAQNPVDT